MPTFIGTERDPKIPIECLFAESPDALVGIGEEAWSIRQYENRVNGFQGPCVRYKFRREDTSDPYREEIVITYWNQDNHPDFESSAQREHKVPLDIALEYYLEKLVIEQSDAVAHQMIRRDRSTIGKRSYQAVTELFEFDRKDVEYRTKGRLYVFAVGNDYVTIEVYSQLDKFGAYDSKFQVTIDTIETKPA
jgi:hypothetical protein